MCAERMVSGARGWEIRKLRGGRACHRDAASALEDTLKAMALDLHVVASLDEAQKAPGANYVLVPTLQRYEDHNQGLTTFAPFIETIVVQWKVLDAKGNTVLPDTAVASPTGKLENIFIAAGRAQDIQNRILDDLKNKSTALLQPLLDLR